MISPWLAQAVEPMGAHFIIIIREHLQLVEPPPNHPPTFLEEHSVDFWLINTYVIPSPQSRKQKPKTLILVI